MEVRKTAKFLERITSHADAYGKLTPAHCANILIASHKSMRGFSPNDSSTTRIRQIRRIAIAFFSYLFGEVALNPADVDRRLLRLRGELI